MSTAGENSSVFGIVADGGPQDGSPDFDGEPGLVLLSYPTGSITATGGTVTIEGANTVHTFASAGSFSFIVTSVDLTIAPPLFTDGDTLYSPNVSQPGAPVTLAPPLVDDADTFPAPTVSPGPVTLAPPLVTDPDSFPSPTVTALSIEAGLVVHPEMLLTGSGRARAGTASWRMNAGEEVLVGKDWSVDLDGAEITEVIAPMVTGHQALICAKLNEQSGYITRYWLRGGEGGEVSTVTIAVRTSEGELLSERVTVVPR